MAANYLVTSGVGATATLVVPAHPGRSFLIVQNTGGAVASFGYDANVTTSNYAFQLTPQSILNVSGLQTYSGPFYAITAGTTTTIAYGDVTQ